MAEDEEETDDAIQEVMMAMCKMNHGQPCAAVRPYRKTEQRVLQAARERDERESADKAFVQKTIVNYVRALIDDRETLEDVRQALGVSKTYELTRMNRIYEPARTHVLQQLVT